MAENFIDVCGVDTSGKAIQVLNDLIEALTLYFPSNENTLKAVSKLAEAKVYLEKEEYNNDQE